MNNISSKINEISNKIQQELVNANFIMSEPKSDINKISLVRENAVNLLQKAYEIKKHTTPADIDLIDKLLIDANLLNYKVSWFVNKIKKDAVANKNLLSEIINNKNISDKDLYLFLVGNQIRSSGGWFFDKNTAKPMYAFFKNSRNLSVEEFYQKYTQQRIVELMKLWKDNEEAQNGPENEKIIFEMVGNNNISDEELYHFLIYNKIRKDGGWFFQKDMPKPLYALFLNSRNLSVEEFYQKYTQKRFVEMMNQWDENAKSQNAVENGNILSELIKNKNISDEELYQFLAKNKIRQAGGWFIVEGHITMLSRLLKTHRNQEVAELYAKFEPVTPSSVDFASPAMRAPTTATPISPVVPTMTIAEPNPVTAADHTTDKSLAKTLFEMDVENLELLSLADKVKKGLPPITVHPHEKEEIEKQFIEVEKFETYLKDKYSRSFNDLGWHGRISFQRIIFQEPEFATKMSNPAFAKAFLIRAQRGMELPLNKDKHTLSGLLLWGLAGTFPSYLATVIPNWVSAPQLPGVTWNKLQIMRISDVDKPEFGKPDIQRLLPLKAAINNIKTILSESTPLTKKEAADMQQIYQRILNAPEVSQISILESIFRADPNNALALTYGAAGPSTTPASMNMQCLEVMSEFEHLLAYEKGDYTAVLGYALVSHALDARHLIAGIWGIQNSFSQVSDGSSLLVEQNSLKDLLEKSKNGHLGPEATALMKIRLNQALMVVVDKLTTPQGPFPHLINYSWDQFKQELEKANA